MQAKVNIKFGYSTNQEKSLTHSNLKINSPEDRFEQEADSMADRVMRMSPSAGRMSANDHRVPPATGLIASSIQRKCAECEEEEKKKGTLMRKAEGGGGFDASSALVSKLGQTQGGGTPLPGETKRFMEGAFSADFSKVRIHADDAAAEMNRGIRAQAFTHGNDIYFNNKQFSPEWQQGRRLLAHELTHVIQQGESTTQRRVRRSPETNGNATPNEDRDIPSLDEASTVVEAIVDIINKNVQIDSQGTVVPKTDPSQHTEVPTKYASLLEQWFIITYGKVEILKGAEVSWRGSELKNHIAQALSTTQPLLDIIIKNGGDAAKSRLTQNFDTKIEEFKQRALSEEVSSSINEDAEKISSSTSSMDEKSDLEKSKVVTLSALNTVRLAMTLVTRYTNGIAVADAKKLDDLFKKNAEAVSGGPAIEEAKILTFPLALIHVKGVLDGINAILAAADPQKREAIFKSSNLFAKGSSFAEITKLILQFVGGTVSIVSAGTYAVSLAMGKVDLAARVVSGVTPKLNNLNFALNAIGLVHGVLVLLDEKSTTDQKADAALEASIGGAGVIGKFVAGFSAPVTLSLVVNFYAFKGILREGAGAYSGLIKWGLNACYADMQKNAEYINSTAIKTAVAIEKSSQESDPARKNELIKQTDALKWNLGVYSLKNYIERATKVSGARNEDPGAYGPLRARFLPLLGRNTNTDADLLQLATDFIEIVIKVKAQAEEIYNQTLMWALDTKPTISH